MPGVPGTTLAAAALQCGPMRGRVIVGAVAGALGACLATAAPALAEDACAREADALRAHLVDAERATYRWNLGWTIAFGASSVGQVVLAALEVNPLGTFDTKYRDTLYVGAAKAGLGFVSRLVMPLRVDVPAPLLDRCADRTVLRATLTRLAPKERRLFWLTHLGGMALNLGGMALLWERHGATTGLVSFAISYPVGTLSAYTLPRGSWKRWRAEQAGWIVGVGTTGAGPSVSLSGAW